MYRYHTILSIAGSDPLAGAGIQADIKSAQALGVYALTAISAVTAQNSHGLSALLPVPADIVEAQVRAICRDVHPDAVKLGMLVSADIVRGVAMLIDELTLTNIVLDPVAAGSAGGELCDNTSALFQAMSRYLFPKVTLITPNRNEAAAILGRKPEETDANAATAAEIAELTGARAVLLKGGDIDSPAVVDYLYDSSTCQVTEFFSSRVHTINSHGTGCTLSSAIAAGLAQGLSLQQAVARAEQYVQQALRAGADWQLGDSRYGPLKHN